MVKCIIPLGKVAYFGTRKMHAVELEVELRKKKNTTAPYLDIHLQPCPEFVELSITGSIWNNLRTDCLSCGQNLETIADFFPNNKRVERIVAIWKRWHLNGMKSGCAHQIAEGWDKRPIDPSKPTDAYVDQGDGHRGWNMLIWLPRSEKHPNGLLGAPCPTCGYKFGTSWLVERLPDDVIKEIRELCSFPPES